MSRRQQAVDLLSGTVFHCFDNEEFGLSLKHSIAITDALVEAGIVADSQRFCTITQNCRLADGHADGCKP